MKKCFECILPENYPGITFNETGVCNYCIAYKDQEYLGDEALKAKIESFNQTQKNRNDNYDCILLLSGGRDSSYLLYYLVKVLNLRVLGYSIDNGFIPEQTKENLKNMVDLLDVKLVIEKSRYLEKCIRHHLLSFIHKPSAPMAGLVCTGCRLGMEIMVPAFSKKSRVPVVIKGSTPQDFVTFKKKIMALNPKSNREMDSFVLGGVFEVIQNPMWILNPTCLVTQIREYYHYLYKRKNKNNSLLMIYPFQSYIKWEEESVVSTIKNELDWRKTPGAESTWRGDCDVALLKLYLYQKTLGFNDRDEGLCYLIRDGQISREEALVRSKEEGQISEEVIKELFDKLGLDFSDLKIALEP